MEIQELFIGAWVLLKIDEGNRILREPHRVTGIMTTNEQPYVQTDESDVYRGLDCYEPILVNADIMSASGFIVDLGSASHTLDFNYWLEYRLKDSMLIKWWNNGWSKGEVNFLCTCRYVHELQTALKLCDSEIEITL